jgi:hypothetical protein
MLRTFNLQRREDHWAIVDMVGKGRHIRTVPFRTGSRAPSIPGWCPRARAKAACFGAFAAQERRGGLA